MTSQEGTSLSSVPLPPLSVNKVCLSDGKHLAGLICADVLDGLRALPDDTFHTAVTSPPYFWARDYGVDGQIGHEDTAEEYVTRLVEVFGEVRRVLHPEGVFYLNIGDTYYSGNGQPHGADPRSPSRNFMRKKMRAVDRSGWAVPKKSLLGIPWKVAIAMQEAGWTIRADIIWNRVNAFVEPTARDRPHRQYEHVFMFSKSRFYSYDRSQLNGEQDVWNIPIERGNAVEHNAAFPRELVRRCILTGSPPGGFVLDPFLGSGTSVSVALEEGRHCVGIELKDAYMEDVMGCLANGGCTRTSWTALEKRLGSDPPGWAGWKGNKRNFRKPGSPR